MVYLDGSGSGSYKTDARPSGLRAVGHMGLVPQTEFLCVQETGFPQSSDLREIERETETENRSKGVREALKRETADFYNPMSTATHHYLCWKPLVPPPTYGTKWKETT